MQRGLEIEDFLRIRSLIPSGNDSNEIPLLDLPEFDQEKIKLVLIDTPAKDFSNDPKRGEARTNRRAAIGLHSISTVVNKELGKGSAIVIDMDARRYTPFDIAKAIRQISKLSKTELTVGLNMFDPNYYLAQLTAIELLKQNNYINSLLIGGRGFTLTNRVFLDSLPESPIPIFGIKGEAEQLVTGLLQGTLDTSLLEQPRTQINMLPIVLPMAILKEYPTPTIPPHEATEGNGHLYHAVNASRSCTYHECEFCASSHDYPYRGYPISWIEDEVSKIPEDEDGIRYFAFNDDNALGTIKRARNVIDMMERLHAKGMKYIWRFLGRGDTLLELDRLGLLRKAHALGLEEIAVGVESADNDILTAMKKGESHETINAAVEAIIRNNIRVKAFTMIGYRGETLGQMEKTIKWLYEKSRTHKGLFRHSLFAVAPYEGTPLHNKLIEDGFSWADLRLYTQAVALENSSLIEIISQREIKFSDLSLPELIELVNQTNEELEMIQKK